MNKTFTFSILICCLGLVQSIHSQNITIIPNSSPVQLINNHLIGGGILTSNITGSLSPGATGSFTAVGNASFTLTGGIILSTGLSSGIAVTPSTHASTGLGTPGNSLLTQIVAPLTTHDAQSITFDFKASSDSVEFDFVFASEEYNEYVNTSFNDVFAFFVTGPGFAPNTNVALIPGTVTPISINTINNGGPTPGLSSGPCTNCSYFIDNIVMPSPVEIIYDGLTTSIKIKFPVWPCSDYSFTIAIADVSDGIFDSAVLLGANSFVACPGIQIDHKLVNSSPDTAYLCTGGSVTLTAPMGPGFSWSTGETTQSITVTQPGIYECVYASGSCFAYTNPVVVVQSGSIQTPVINQNGPILESNIIPTPSISYQWSLNGTVIPGANASVYTPTVNGCYKLTIFEGNCEAASNIICVTTTSVAELLSRQVTIIPNPSSGIVKIKTPFSQNSLTKVGMMDVSGRLVFEANATGTEFITDISVLSAGMYVMMLENSEAPELIRLPIVVTK